MAADGAGAFGLALREARTRSGLTLREMAQRCGTNHTHLSRLETTPERIPSRDLLNRILNAIDDPDQAARIAAAAGRLTPKAESLFSGLPRAVAEPAMTRWTLPMLRRIDAAVAAESFLAGLPGRAISGNRVDPEVLCRAQGLRPLVRAEEGPAASFGPGGLVIIRDPGVPGDAGALPRVRFLLAHAAAHALRKEPNCTFPYVDSNEKPALDMAAYLLCPLALLRRVFTAALLDVDEDVRNPWSSHSANLVSVVAQRMAVPGWVAVRRLSDAALLDDEALYYTLGDQP